MKNDMNDMIDRIHSKWRKFSKRKIQSILGDLDELVGMIQSVYGYPKDRAEREYHDFRLSLRPAFCTRLSLNR